MVSSHTPARGVSELVAEYPPRHGGFKSYPREGGIGPWHIYIHLFICFKSYPREGGIIIALSLLLLYFVSSHTPARGVSNNSERALATTLFQVIPPRGGYPAGYVHCFILYRFQVIPPRGGYQLAQQLFDSRYVFQVIPPRGGYLNDLRKSEITAWVSSHTPARGVSV